MPDTRKYHSAGLPKIHSADRATDYESVHDGVFIGKLIIGLRAAGRHSGSSMLVLGKCAGR